MSSTGWERSRDYPHYREKILKDGEHTIRILRPELDRTEQEKRELQAKRILERTLSNYYIRKEATP